MPKKSLPQYPPTEFLAKMADLLGDEYEAFLHSYNQPNIVGLRVNTLKITVADFISKAPFALSPVGTYAPAGFRVLDESKPGRHPYHAAGLYYLQEPAAMSVAALLRPYPGERILDLAAAPGGKTSHLASLMGDTGLLVANDVHRGRAAILASNMERWGTRNTLILNETPQHLAAHFGSIFDKVLLDAPCSGEGMFRRQGGFEWRDEIVAACALRQSGILSSAAQMVRPGGHLAYTTCTFSPEENEMVIGQFLTAHPDFMLVALPQISGFAPGRPEWAGEWADSSLQHTARLWPHRFAGEGHFVALLQRSETAVVTPKPPLKTIKPGRADRTALQQWSAFAQQNLRGDFPDERLLVSNGRVYLLPEQALETGKLRLVRYGLLLGEARRGYFKPAHTLALVLTVNEVQHSINWPADATEVKQYLAGQDLPRTASAGWTLVTVDGSPLGWGKQVGDRLKNHYPRGLRQSL